jgi:hypothetical protein
MSKDYISSFFILNLIFSKKDNIFGALQRCGAAAAGINIAAYILLLLASHNNPAASAVATDTAVADVIAVVGFPGVRPSCYNRLFCCRPTCSVVVLTAVDVQKAPAVANVSDLPPYCCRPTSCYC